MKICIFGDLHFEKEINKNSSIIDGKLLESVNNMIFDMKQLNINTCIQLGDLFNNRKSINVLSGNNVLSYFQEFIDNKIFLYQIIGNHDCFYNNTNVNSLSLLTKYNKSEYIKIINDQYIFEDKSCGLVSWNPKFSDTFKTKYLFGHFDILGFEMKKNIECRRGINSDFLSNYNIVFSGHYHRKSNKKNIIYTGSLLDLEFCDSDIDHGYYILNTDNDEIEFIKNKITLYKKIIYDDDPVNVNVENKLVRIVCKKVTDQKKFDNYIKSLLENGAIEVKTIDISKDNNAINIESDICEIKDYDEMAKEYIKELKLMENINKEKLIDLFIKLHQKAKEGTQ